VSDKNICVSDFSGWPEDIRKGYFSAVSLLIFMVPLILMVILYWRILVALRRGARREREARHRELGGEAREVPERLRVSLRINHHQAAQPHGIRSTVKATNLSITVVILFIVTNLPYIVDEFIRQEILTNPSCTSSTCLTVKAFLGLSIVSNSAINPFIFLLFNSKSPRAQALTRWPVLYDKTNPLLKQKNTNICCKRYKHRSNNYLLILKQIYKCMKTNPFTYVTQILYFSCPTQVPTGHL